MLDNIEVFSQSSIKIKDNKIIYFDPFQVNYKYNDADIIFITHDHYDHFDIKSINNVINENTIIVVPSSLVNQIEKVFNNKIVEVIPNKEYCILGVKFKTIRAYNINKSFHPKENNWVGYLITSQEKKYYIMGDTDDTKDARDVKCDVLFVPIGGTYTMDYNEAAEYTNFVNPKIVVPIHYGSIVGSSNYANYFKEKINENIIVEIKMKL